MDRVRMMADVRVLDYEGAVDAVGRLAEHVEERHPSVLAWDCYFDETGERMYWFQEHTSQQTLLDYERVVSEFDYVRRIRDYLEFERLVVLGPVTDPELLAFLEGFPTVLADHTLGAAR